MGAAAVSKLPGRSVFRFYSNYRVGVATASRKERFSELSGYFITESGITESGITWEIGIRYNGTWYNRISYNIKVECGITESSITETGITWKFESGIWYNTKKESAITESGITESGITRKRNLA